MKIAQVAPLYECVPPVSYGGTERIVSYLTEELVARGHDVTLFASGDSVTAAKLVGGCERALRLNGARDPIASHIGMLEQVFRRAHEFDVIHFHTETLHLPLAARQGTVCVTTLHGRLDEPDITRCLGMFPTLPMVSISDAQRAPVPELNWQKTIYHGLPRDLYRCRPSPGEHLAFVGRISPEKRLDRAVEIAGRAGLTLKVAAKLDDIDRAYYQQVIRDLLQQPHVEYLGEIGDAEKNELLGGALGLLFPIDWPEPFGLVMIEAMACGTPVIALPCGSVPEVVDPGKTGFVVTSVDEAVRAVAALPTIDRAGCRRVFEQRFSVERMTSDYLAVYQDLTAPRWLHEWSPAHIQRSSAT